MSSTARAEDNRGGGVAQETLRWKGRNHFNFLAGRSRLRAVPVVLHLLPEDIDWFAKDPSLFRELKSLLRDRVVSATNDGERDAEAPKSRKRARKEELCVQGERLQFTYRYRKTLPRYTVLSYANNNAPKRGAGDSSVGLESFKNNSRTGEPEFRHYPLSDSTLLVWVYRFDAEDPYHPVPNEAALQFAPTPVKSRSSSMTAGVDQPLDFEATGTDYLPNSVPIGDAQNIGVQTLGGPRDAGILRWLWGWEKDGEGGAGSASRGGGGVRQHFIGSAAWQGRPDMEKGRGRLGKEDDDLHRAISLSLEERGAGGGAGSGDAVEVVDNDYTGVEETKGGSR